MSVATSETPPRGTRPHNRRELIVNAAAVLFYDSGYPHVSMGDIAHAVGVGPSALYRHFPGKQELLAEILTRRVESFTSRVNDAQKSADPMDALAEAALAHRDVGVLWERESRHLDDTTRREMLRSVRVVVDVIREIVSSRRPGLSPEDSEALAWVAIGTLNSASFQRVVLPGERLAKLLAEMTSAAVDAPRFTGIPSAVIDEVSTPVPRSRREELLGAAIAQFAERGYQDVGIEDIAAAAGLTGTSIYRYFGTKREMLLAAMIRGAEWLRLDLNRALGRADDAEGSLRALVVSYLGLVIDQPDLISVLITEVGHLPETDRRRIAQEQRDYIDQWLRLLAAVHPQESAAEARCRAQAVFTLANSCARNPHLRERPDLGEVLRAGAEGALGIPSASSAA